MLRNASPRPRLPGRAAALAALLLATAVALASAHDMFLKPADFFPPEGGQLLVRLLNGTFSQSENSIARGRLLDVSIVSPAGRTRVDTSEWSVAGDTSTFQLRTGGAGTYVLGVSTRPNIIELTAEEFNAYLDSDGIPDVLAARRRDGELGRGVRERYAKHVKAILQVGAARTPEYGSALGYPAEVVPLDNPYAVRPGGNLRVRVLLRGQPLVNQYVLYGGRTPDGGRIEPRSARSGSDGVATIPLARRGTWYVKFIHMARLEGDPAADYESTWATLSFAIR